MQTKCKFGSASSMMNHHGAVLTLSHQLHLKSCNFNVSKMVGKWAFSSEFCGSFFSRCIAFSHQTVSCRCKLKEVKFGENAFEMLETKFARLMYPRTLSWNFACTLPAGVWIMQLRCTWNYRNWQVQDDASLWNWAHTVVWIMHLLGTFAQLQLQFGVMQLKCKVKNEWQIIEPDNTWGSPALSGNFAHTFTVAVCVRKCNWKCGW